MFNNRSPSEIFVPQETTSLLRVPSAISNDIHSYLCLQKLYVNKSTLGYSLAINCNFQSTTCTRTCTTYSPHALYNRSMCIHTHNYHTIMWALCVSIGTWGNYKTACVEVYNLCSSILTDFLQLHRQTRYILTICRSFQKHYST